MIERTIAAPTVFVVDDDDAIRESLSFLLEAEGFRVETYDSGADFLARYRPQRPGCLLLDVGMPGMSGLDVQQQLAGLGIGIPIIFMTGRGDSEMARKAATAGAFAFFNKPPEVAMLTARLREALEADRRSRGA